MALIKMATPVLMYYYASAELAKWQQRTVKAMDRFLLQVYLLCKCHKSQSDFALNC